MAPELVVDASVWIGYLVNADAHHHASVAWVNDTLLHGVTIARPTLALAEIGGVMARRTQRAVSGVRAIERIERVPNIAFFALDHELARESGLLTA